MRVVSHVALLIGVSVLAAGASGETNRATESASKRQEAKRTAYRLPVETRLQGQTEHTLLPAVRLAAESYRHIRRDIRDYTCTLVRRERVDGRLQGYEYIAAKVRHRRTRNGKTRTPFSLYLKFLSPSKVKGREVLYVEGQNEGQMYVRNGGQRFAFVTTELLPNSELAMRGNRYPVTELGFENLIRRLMEVAREDMAITENCNVTFFNDAKVNGRVCMGVQVTHPVRDERLRFHQAKVFMDEEWQIPVHYESYGWPPEPDAPPRLLEQYTYTNVKINVGLSDRDFEHTNPEYELR